LSDLPAHSARMNNMQIEMELVQNSVKPCRPVRTRRSPGARWWFDQMHTVVDRAFEWSRTAQPRPEQTYISFGARPRHGKA
jgi:hypothetical protein